MNAGEDIAVVWDPDGSEGAWQLTGNGGLLTAPALETAVYVSLFTDARAKPSDLLPPGVTDRRGWWGNAVPDADGETRPIGSRLWLLRRAARRPDTLLRAREMMDEALAWFVEDGIAEKVTVEARWASPTRMGAAIAIHQAGGRATVRTEFLWDALPA